MTITMKEVGKKKNPAGISLVLEATQLLLGTEINVLVSTSPSLVRPNAEYKLGVKHRPPPPRKAQVFQHERYF